MAGRITAELTIFALLVAAAHCSSGLASFSYGVSDPNTGDIKDQHEKRDGGNVVGKYSLLESDGTKRVVEYSASDATGFNAVVHKVPAAGAINALGQAGLTHGGLAAHGGLGVGASAIYGGSLTASPLAHGAQNALSYANSNIINSALAHGSAGHGSALAGGLAGNLAGGYAGHAASQPAVSQYAHSIVHDVRPYAGQYAGAYGGIGAQSSLGHGAALGSGSLGYGHGSSLAGGLALNQAGLGGNLAGGYAGHGASTVSKYSNSIVHDVRPYAGQYTGGYGGYGAQASLSNSAALGHGALASPLANAGWTSPLANAGWTSPLANAGWTSPTANAGWTSPAANAGWTSPNVNAGWTSPLGRPGLGAAAPAMAHGALGANAGWRW